MDLDDIVGVAAIGQDGRLEGNLADRRITPPVPDPFAALSWAGAQVVKGVVPTRVLREARAGRIELERRHLPQVLSFGLVQGHASPGHGRRRDTLKVVGIDAHPLAGALKRPTKVVLFLEQNLVPGGLLAVHLGLGARAGLLVVFFGHLAGDGRSLTLADHLLGYHQSVATGVGFIALAGVSAEFGVVMLIYLKHALAERGADPNDADLIASVREGALLRVRPKAMTVAVILAGLAPILVGHGAGSEVMSRIAAPMIGGMLTAPLLSMLVIPAGYLLLRRRRSKRVSTSQPQRSFP